MPPFIVIDAQSALDTPLLSPPAEELPAVLEQTPAFGLRSEGRVADPSPVLTTREAATQSGQRSCVDWGALAVGLLILASAVTCLHRLIWMGWQ